MTKAQQQIVESFAGEEAPALPVEQVFKKKPKLARELARLAQEYVDIRDSIKALEEQKRQNADAILTSLLAEDVRSVVAAKHTFTQAKGRVSRKIDGGKLIRLGVAVDIVEAATTVTEGAPYLVCTAAKV